mgnify:CR=1 FL=1
MEMLMNGKIADASDLENNELAQVVLVSLFSWRKSASDDGVSAPNRQGWWGDTYADVAGDRIGSRLWLLDREKVLPPVLRKAEEYVKEALQWLLDDKIVGRVEVTAERYGMDGASINVTLYKPDDTQILNARFQDVWR